jgi:hypothetical protein
MKNFKNTKVYLERFSRTEDLNGKKEVEDIISVATD